MTRIKITDAMWNGWMGKILYVPLLNILVLLYVYIPGQDLGLAIIVLTILIRLVLYPSYRDSLKSQRDLQKVQPKIDQIKAQHKDDSQKQSQEVMKIYKEHNINLFASCLPLIIQLPILLALYRVFIAGLDTSSLVHLYSWFPHPPTELHTTFLAWLHIPGLVVDLTTRNIYLAILAGAVQFFQSWLTTRYHHAPKTDKPQLFNTQLMMYIFPVMTLVIAWSLPAALGLYWTTTTVAMAVQMIIIYTSLQRRDARAANQPTDDQGRKTD
ncbi:MAG: YidC/Oxa1 family membrane protein insertase [bacterium]